MKTWVCTVCGYVWEGENPPEKCPQCGVGPDKFKEQSAGKIADLLGPVKEKFDEFRKSVESSEKTSVAVKTSLEEQIRSLVEQSGKVGDEARNLACPRRPVCLPQPGRHCRHRPGWLPTEWYFLPV